MPLYEYQCRNCGAIFEMFFPLKEWDVKPSCLQCGGPGKKIISAQIQRDEPTWLNNEVRECLQDAECEKPIETRTEYNRYLKDNGIIERS